MKHHAIIVGAGLAGSIAAAACRKAGATVTLIDARLTDAGSAPAACLLRPSWLNGLTWREKSLAYATLIDLYGMKRLHFDVGLPVKVDIDWVDPKQILRGPTLAERVMTVYEDGTVMLESGKEIKGDSVLVAAGIHTPELVSMPPMRALMGASCLFPGQLKEPRMRVWAPYKQAIAFNINDQQIWFGDGTSILLSNWNHKSRVAATVARAEKLFGLRNPAFIMAGARPSVTGHTAGYFARRKRLWVATGGAKNGTVIAALHARRFVQEALK